uniref:Uncharacterized protein n=1 Tax=Knipowitschia caucasica TaxID=637954 RepID=A0AAV2KTH7_KNICA
MKAANGWRQRTDGSRLCFNNFLLIFANYTYPHRHIQIPYRRSPRLAAREERDIDSLGTLVQEIPPKTREYLGTG